MATGISYLVSKTIATVISKQIIREKSLPLHRDVTQVTKCARANKALMGIMADITNPPRFKVVFGNKTDNPNQYPLQAFYLGTKYL
jgi:hypothetical protein